MRAGIIARGCRPTVLAGFDIIAIALYKGLKTMESTTPSGSRPAAVTVAAICLVIGNTAGLLQILLYVHLETRLAHILIAVVIGASYLGAWFIFQGKKWARWLILIIIVLGLGSGSGSVQRILEGPALEIALCGVRMLTGYIAAISLLTRAAGEWFQRHKKDIQSARSGETR